MPKPPTGKLIYATTNNYAIPLPIDELLEAAVGLPRLEFAQLPEAMRKKYTEMVLKVFKPLQQQITMKSPGACNAMVLTFLGRVFRKINSIESPWLTSEEIVQLIRRQRRYILNLLQIRMKEQSSSAPVFSHAQANLAGDRGMIETELADGFDLNPMRESAGAASDSEVAGIAASLKAASLCLLAIEFPSGSGRPAGHAIALINEGAKWYVLDPNFGLYRYESEETFTADLLRLLTEYGTTSYFLLGVSPGIGEPTGLSKQLLARVESRIGLSPEPSRSDALLDGMPFTSRSGNLMEAMNAPVSQSGQLLKRMQLIS